TKLIPLSVCSAGESNGAPSNQSNRSSEKTDQRPATRTYKIVTPISPTGISRRKIRSASIFSGPRWRKSFQRNAIVILRRLAPLVPITKTKPCAARAVARHVRPVGSVDSDEERVSHSFETQ